MASHPLDHLQVVRRRLKLGIAVAIVVTFVAAYRTSQKVPIYRATTQIAVESELQQSLLRDSAVLFDPYWYDMTNLATQQHVLQSEPVAEGVVEALELASRDEPLAFEAAIQRVRTAVRIEQLEGTRLFRISADSSDAETAARLANTVADTYIHHQTAKRTSSTHRSLTWLRDQLSELETRLEESQLALIDYIDAVGFPGSTGPNGELRNGQGKNVRDAHDEARTELIRRQAELDTLQGFATEGVSAATLRGLADDDGALQEYAQRIDDLEIELAQNSKRYGDKHPVIVGLRSDIKTMGEQAQQTIDKRALELRARIATMQAQRGALGSGVEADERRSIESAKNRIRYDILQQKVETNKSLYNIILEKLGELDVTSEVEESTISVVERAKVPPAPVSPDKPREYALSLAAGLLLGLATCFLVEYLDRGIKSAEEAEELLHLPVLASLPEIRDAAKETVDRLLITPESPHSGESEVFRSLRSNLYLSSPERNPSLLVTSASPREGKTTVATNLAAACASNEVPTVIIDADLRRPQIHRLLDLDNTIGLTSYLSGQIPLERIIRPTQIAGLSAIPSGPMTLNPPELLESPGLTRMLAELKQQFRQIIVDSPPAASLSDAWLLANRLTGVVFVVHERRSERRDVLKAKAQLVKTGAKIFGIVLNAVSSRNPDYHYYYQDHREPAERQA